MLHTPSLTKLGLVALCCSSPSIGLAPAGPVQRSGEPSGQGKADLQARTIGGFSVWNLFNAVREYLADKNAWDPDIPGKCALAISTTNGAQCHAYLQCEMTDAAGDIVQPDPWSNCYLHGTQNFSNSDIGDFSITFTKAGGKEGNTQDGLHTPVLRFANLNSWEALDVDQVVAAESGQAHGKLCESYGQDSITLGWTCGIPKVGQQAFGISNIDTIPNQNNLYTKGRCTMHVVQYQRNQYGVGNDYAFDVILYDAVQKQLAVKQQAVIDPTTKSLVIDSALPLTVVITAGGDDDSDVTFCHGDQTWACGDGTDTGGDHQCNLGGPGEKRWG